ncbi:MAG: serine/threonine-protein kinase [Bryobacteraceae bacterium]|nr:serine/threonine-protein kinase [Bryobacteraceae bacterium]
MNEQAAVHITPGATKPSGLPDENIYQRLSWAAVLYAAVYVIVSMTGNLSGAFLIANGPYRELANLATLFAVLVSAGVFVLARKRWLGPALMADVGLLFAVLAAAGIDLHLCFIPIPRELIPLGISWIGVWILCVVFIVPSTVGKAMLAALASASMTPLFLLIGMARGSADPSTAALILFIVPNYVVVLIAFASSRILYGLRQQVQEARRMGGYQLVALLGQGGMGEVWRAQHHTLARPAAIKLIRPSSIPETNAQTAFRRFEREAQATASLRSIHTITLYDFGISDDGSFYYVMELLEGLDLQRLVTRFGPLPAARAAYLLRQVCHSLAEAHVAGLIHRDIKPANIYICHLGPDYDFVKVLDFGLVKPSTHGAADEITQLTQTGVTAGTPAFMAPEMALGKPEIDHRSDIYSLGCVAYWLLTGQQPFKASSPVEMVMRHLQDSPELPSRRTELAIPAELDSVILACLEKDPAKRPQTMEELSARLEPVAEMWNSGQAARWWRTNLPELARWPGNSNAGSAR